MYDSVRFEIDAYKYKDLDKRLPLEYSRYVEGEFGCWSDCGCHWFVVCRIEEEFQFREWLYDKNIEITNYVYIPHPTQFDYKVYLLNYLKTRIMEIKKVLKNQDFCQKNGLGSSFKDNARFQLIYVVDGVENLYGIHSRPFDLYIEAVNILERVYNNVDSLDEVLCKIQNINLIMPGFYFGKKIKLMSLDKQLEGDIISGVRIKLFDLELVFQEGQLNITHEKQKLTVGLFAVKKTADFLETKKISIDNSNKFIIRRTTAV